MLKEKIKTLVNLAIYRKGNITDKISPNWIKKDISEVIADIDKNLKKSKNDTEVVFVADKDFSDKTYISIKSADYADFKEFKQAVKDTLICGACTIPSERYVFN